MYRKFKLSRLADAQQRAGLGAGSIGYHPGAKSNGKRTEVIPNNSIGKPSRVYQKGGKTQRSITNKERFESVRFKASRPDMMGLSRGKVPQRAEYLGEQSLDYNPFIHTLGAVEEGAQVGGGDYDSSSQPTEYSVNPKFKIQKSTKGRLGKIQVGHNEAFPNTLLDNHPVQYTQLVKLK